VSEYTALRAASRTLHALLKRDITDSGEPEIGGIAVDLRSPKELRADGVQTAVSLWLYRVTRNADLLNAPPERLSPTEVRGPGLPLALHYLVTPIADDTDVEQVLLGRAMQVLQDHAIVRSADFADSLVGERTELRVTLDTLSLEELTRVWDALKEPYELSASYRVQVLTIESPREPLQIFPVVERRTGLAQITAIR
jgi:hypothetical protein